MSIGRRSLLAATCVRWCCVVLAVGLAACGSVVAAVPPNIVLIVADDLGTTAVGAYGNAYYQTPHIDRIGREGIRFTAAYAAAPVCSPSRAALMTGKHPARLHLTDFIPGAKAVRSRLRQPDWRPYLPLEEATIAEVLAARGYATALFGKWHLARAYAGPKSLAEGPDRQGFAETFLTRKPTPDHDPEQDPHTIGAISAKARDFIARHRSRPFFLCLAHQAIHAPVMAPSAVVEKHRKRTGAGEPGNDPVIAAMMEMLDDSVGEVLEQLRNLGLLENTVVIFTSDNGGLLDDAAQTPWRGGKAQLYEGGIRVPLLVRWPGIVDAGRTTAIPVTSMDLFTTLVAAAGAEVSQGDGVSLLPLLRGGSPPDRECLFWHYPHDHAAGIHGPASAIRCGDWKWIEYHEHTVCGTGATPELFNLREDPAERHNRAGQEPAVASRLRERLSAWRASVGAQMPTENPLPGATPTVSEAAPPPAAASTAVRPDVVRTFLLEKIDEAAGRWRVGVDALAGPADVTARQTRLAAAFREAIGPFPDRVPLDPRVTGRVEKDGYAVEKIVYTSQPGVFVTAGLFLPDAGRFPSPWPAVLVACGHAEVGKAHDSYQRAAALLATNGIAALLFDPVGQGERRQIVDARGNPACPQCTREHTALGAALIPLGRNLAGWMVWDGIRGLDYLASRADIRGDRLGCMGNSGGGTQTAYLMALDDRVSAAAVSCYLASLQGRLPRTIGPQDAEQNIFGQLAFGMDHADFIIMRAPRPTLVCAATQDFFDIADTRRTVADARRVYELFAAGDRLAMAEADAKHGFVQPLREAACRFLLRWLADRDQVVAEPPGLEVLSVAEMACLPQGSVLELPGARSFVDLAAAEARRLAEARGAGLPPDLLRERARSRSGMRPADAAAAAARVTVVSARNEGDGRVERLDIETVAGVVLPAELWTPAAGGPSSVSEPRDVVFVTGDGLSGAAAAIGKIVAEGRQVLAVDPRGMGGTLPAAQQYFDVARHGPNGQDFYLAYLLGRSLVGMQADDIVACGRWLGEADAPEDAGRGAQVPRRIALVAVGLAAVPAVHAAAVHPDVFASCRCEDPPRSWSSYVADGPLAPRPLPLASLVHGALLDYDFPELIALTAPGR